jgi:hypothetical protein
LIISRESLKVSAERATGELWEALLKWQIAVSLAGQAQDKSHRFRGVAHSVNATTV